MTDRQFAISGKWAVASDGHQWMLQRQHMHKGRPVWHSVSFVASTKDVLARCMRAKGCPPADAERLLSGLPSTFTEWANRASFQPEAALTYPRLNRHRKPSPEGYKQATAPS